MPDDQKVWVEVFGSSIPVTAGAAAPQPVRWRPDLWRDVASAAGRPDLLAEMGQRFPDVIRREDLWQIGAEVTEDTAALAYLAVMAWGLGTKVRRGRPQVIRGLQQRDERRLLVSAAGADGGLSALWQAHFRETKPPLYLGQVAFGTKWLHAAGWLRTPVGGPRPLIFDQYVHNTLANCLNAPLAYPGTATNRTRAAWQAWCEEADHAASGHAAMSSADVELAVFRHSRDDLCPRSRGEDAACLWVAAGDGY